MRPGAGRAARIGALVGVVASCSAAVPPAGAPASAAGPGDGAGAVLGPARYLVGDHTVVERTEDGLERAVVGGRRLELRGLEIVAVAPAAPGDPDVQEGARAPSWAAGAPARYVFWKGKQLWGAETFMGPLHLVATLPAEPRGSFDWLDGTGLVAEGGALVAPPSGAAPHRLGVPAAARSFAGDARRAVAVSALGHDFLTLDGGASYRDVSAELGSVAALERRGDALVAFLSYGRERFVTAAGTIADEAPPSARYPAAGSRPLSIPDADPFRDASSVRPLDAALRAGLPLADGGVVIAANGFVGRLDPATLRSTSVAALDPGLRDAECTPVRSAGSVVLACVGSDRAAVVDLDGPPRTERTFDLAGASDLVRFAASGDALGYLGACDGTPPRVPDEGARGEESFSSSRERTPVFCVRVGRDEWVEHHVDPTEAADVLAWIPRVAGGAVALVARPVPFLDDRERVSARGALRVLRLGRTEPPLQLTPYAYRRAESVAEELRVLADDTVVGFLPSNGHAWGALSVAIDPGGHVHAHEAPPLASQLALAGRFALTSGDDGRLWETTDSGRTWAAVEPPPSSRLDEVRPSSCSAVGCAVGGFARLGWGGAPERAPVRPPPPRERYRRPLPAPPLVRLACAPAGPSTGRRIADSGGFGYTPQPVPRNGVLNRIGALGVVSIPWLSSAAMPTSGDIDMAWLAPLDVAGVIHRLTLPIAGLGLSSSTPRPYDLHVGYLLEPDGGLEVFAAGPPHQCLPGLLETARVARPLGACALDGSVGVDLGGRVVVVRAGPGGIDVSVAEAPPDPASRRGAARGAMRAAAVPVPLHFLHQNAGEAVTGVFFGAGARRGEPVVVVVDGGGGAALAPIDAARGTVGAEERLRPLTEAKLGSSPACAQGAGRLGGDEARVVLPFEGLIGIDRRSIPGVGQGFGTGVAVLRWSRERACLDAVEVSVHDDRYDESPGPYEPHGGLRKIVARFDGKGQAGLVLVGMGTETRQPLACTGLASGPEAAP